MYYLKILKARLLSCYCILSLNSRGLSYSRESFQGQAAEDPGLLPAPVSSSNSLAPRPQTDTLGRSSKPASSELAVHSASSAMDLLSSVAILSSPCSSEAQSPPLPLPTHTQSTALGSRAGSALGPSLCFMHLFSALCSFCS